MVSLLPTAAAEALLSSKCRKDVLKVDPTTEPSLRSKPTKASLPAEAAETREASSTTEGITSGGASCVGVEAGGTKLVILLTLLGIGEDFV